MAAPGLIGSTVSKIFSNIGKGCNIQQTRNKWANAKQLRDYKRRMVAKEYAPLRARLISMKRSSDILPPELKDYIWRDLAAVPRQAHLSQLNMRCVVTSRARGVVFRWRLSRFIFRHLVDYNKLSGIQRAIWG